MARKKITTSQRFRILERDGFRCKYCGADSSTTLLEIDHVVPVVNGGTNDDSNLVVACRECNNGKSGRNLKDSSMRILQLRSLQKLILGGFSEFVEQVYLYTPTYDMLEEFGYEKTFNAISNLIDEKPFTSIVDVQIALSDAYFNLHEEEV